MGANFSPSLTNLFMAVWEEEFLFSTSNTFSDSIQWYGRFIDDLLLLGKGPVSSIEDFIIYINQNPLNLKFTFHHDNRKIEYLDIQLEGSPDNKVLVTPYRKPTAGNSILLATPCHLHHVVKNLPIGEHIRHKRNCTNENDFSIQETEVCNRLRERKYPEWALKCAQK